MTIRSFNRCSIFTIEMAFSNREILLCTFDEMTVEQCRLETFEKWKGDVPPIALAKAGFFHIPYSIYCDSVRCAFCYGEVHHWESSDEPLEEHRRHYPRCPFIMGYEVGNIPNGVDPIAGPRLQLLNVLGIRKIKDWFYETVAKRFGINLHQPKEIVAVNDGKEVDDRLACKICYERNSCVVTLPCRHLALCEECIKKCITCNYCRAPIEATVNVFIP